MGLCLAVVVGAGPLRGSAATTDAPSGRDATPADWRVCESRDAFAADFRRESCTRLLASASLPAADRARALVARSETEGGDAALRDLDEAIRLDPSNDEYFRLRARLRQVRHDIPGAIADMGELIARHPGDLSTLRARAELLLAQGRYGDAIADLDAVIAAQADDGFAYEERGVARWRSLDFAEGSPAPGKDDGFALLQRAACRQIRADCKEVTLALADLGRAIDLLSGRGRAGALSERARILADRDDFRGALADLDEAVRLAAGDAALLAARGGVRRRAGDLAGARADLDEAVRLAPREPRYLAERADVRFEMDDVAGARADLDDALRQPASAAGWDWLDAALKMRRQIALPDEPGMGPELKDLRISRVSPLRDPSGANSVSITLDDDAARRFAAFTTMHVGSRTQILVDGEVIAQPRITSPIPGGSLVISGGFSLEDVAKLAARLGAPGASMTVRALP